MNKSVRAYHGVAIALHWLIAVLIIGLLIIGNFMVRLEDADPLRYVLTQWHKSFGVIVLVLVVLRLVWRLTHRPPPLPQTVEPWEARMAGLAHLALYLLILLIPVSGWIMVSASPLEIPTLLFNGIEWPHLPPFDSMPDKAAVSDWFAGVHEYAAWILVAVLLAHIGAALRHQYWQGDEVMARMSPKSGDGFWRPQVTWLSSLLLVVLAGLIIHGYGGSKAAPLAAGSESQVGFEFVVQDAASEGAFEDSSVEMALDSNNLAASSLRARVNTASVASGNSQIDSTLVGSDWFDVKNHPQASFESTAIVSQGDGRYTVSGELQIRGVVQALEFPLQLETRDGVTMASGSFAVHRLDYGLGADSQPDDDSVGYIVTVKFAFELR